MIEPVVLEPVVQFTLYLKLKYEVRDETFRPADAIVFAGLDAPYALAIETAIE